MTIYGMDMATMTETSWTGTSHMALCPRTGVLLRAATADEVAAYEAQPCRHPAFRKAVRVDEVLVDSDTGAGIWYGGAGF